MNRQLVIGILLGLIVGVSLGAMQQSRSSGSGDRFHFVPVSEKVAWCMDDRYGTFFLVNVEDEEAPIRSLGSTSNAKGRKEFE